MKYNIIKQLQNNNHMESQTQIEQALRNLIEAIESKKEFVRVTKQGAEMVDIRDIKLQLETAKAALGMENELNSEPKLSIADGMKLTGLFSKHFRAKHYGEGVAVLERATGKTREQLEAGATDDRLKRFFPFEPITMTQAQELMSHGFRYMCMQKAWMFDNGMR